MAIWQNYKQAEDLPPEVVERMWRTLDRIATACGQSHPADPDYLTKRQMGDLAEWALPDDADTPKAREVAQ